MPTLRVLIDSSRAKAGASDYVRSVDRMDRASRTSAVGIGTLDRRVDLLAASMTRLKATLFSLPGLLLTVATGGIALMSKNMVNAAAIAEDTQSKFDVVFRGVEADAEAAAAAISDAFGRSLNATKGQLAALGDTFVPLGYAREQSLLMADAVVRLANDLASFNPAVRNSQDAVDALTSALIGNHETVRKFGVIITEADLAAAAYKHGIAEVGAELTNQQKVAARYALILEGTADAQGDAIRTSESWKNTMERLSGGIDDVQARVGDDLKNSILDTITAMGGLDTLLVAIEIAFQLAAAATNAFFKAIVKVGELLNGLDFDALRRWSDSLRELNGLAVVGDEVDDLADGLNDIAAFFDKIRAKALAMGDDVSESYAKLSKEEALEENVKALQAALDAFRNTQRSAEDAAARDSDRTAEKVGDAFGDAAARSVQEWKGFQALLVDILSDVQRIAIRNLIAEPIAKGVTGLFSANGNVFSNGKVQFMAAGGYIDNTTIFPMRNGGIAVAGEAGREVAVETVRTSTGKLGVAAMPGGGGHTFNFYLPGVQSPQDFLSSERQIKRRLRGAF